MPKAKTIIGNTIYIVSWNAVRDKLVEVAKQSPQVAKELAQLIYATLEKASNGYWGYEVVSGTNLIGEGYYGFGFVAVGGIVGFTNETLCIYFDRKKRPEYKKWHKLINNIADEYATIATIISYVQSGVPPSSTLGSVFADIALVTVTAGKSWWNYNKVYIESEESNSRLSKIARAKPFQYTTEILEFGVNGLFGASWLYYAYDLADSFSYPLPFNAQDIRLQIFLGFFYASLNFASKGSSNKHWLNSILRVVKWFTLFVNALYAASNSFYIVTEVVMDALVAILNNDDPSNTMENNVLICAGAMAAVSFAYYFVENKKTITNSNGRTEEILSEQPEAGESQPLLQEQGRPNSYSARFFSPAPSSSQVAINVVQPDYQRKAEEELFGIAQGSPSPMQP